MQEIILCKLGELVLKGLNRSSFEDKLLSSTRRRLKPLGQFKVSSRQSTVYIEPQEEGCDLEAAFQAVGRIFGYNAISLAKPCPKEKEAIVQTAIDYLREPLLQAKSFKVESKRSDKQFPLTSIALSQYVGGALHDAYPHLQVDVHQPELTVYVEVRDSCAYVHGPARPGAGGLPIGTGGQAVAMLSGGIDSPAACWMMARRGVKLELIHFFSPPYTSPEAREKVLQLARELTAWCGRLTVHVIPFTEIQEEIRRNCPEACFTLIMRRLMMRIACRLASELGAGAIVTGENLGQVASQTMEALACTDDVAQVPVLRPLVGMDKEEIIGIARHIGTFDTSVLPYEDCCTVFTPRHPWTHPKVEEIRKVEQALEVEALIQRALEGDEPVRLRCTGGN